jgi:hypothetical protein
MNKRYLTFLKDSDKAKRAPVVTDKLGYGYEYEITCCEVTCAVPCRSIRTTSSLNLIGYHLKFIFKRALINDKLGRVRQGT